MAELSERSLSSVSMPIQESQDRSNRVEIASAVTKLRSSFAPQIVRSLRSKLPRMLFAGRQVSEEAAQDLGGHIFPPEICDFAALTLSIDADAASAYVDRLLGKGVTIETVFLDWLAPAARRLGAQWETDETDFAAVTLGVNRLHMIMRRLGEDFCFIPGGADAGGAALLTATSGEQHTFGLSMTAEFFRRAGWTLSMGPFATQQEIVTLVRHQWFDVVGFAVSSDRRLDELRREIDAIRNGSRNRLVGIMLGGPMMEAHPEWLQMLGGDLISTDAATAPQSALDLTKRMKARPPELSA